MLHKWNRVDEWKKKISLEEPGSEEYNRLSYCAPTDLSVVIVVNQLLTSPVYCVISCEGDFSFTLVTQVVRQCLCTTKLGISDMFLSLQCPMTSHNLKIIQLAKSICSITHKYNGRWNSRAEPSSCWLQMSVACWRLYDAIAMAPFHLTSVSVKIPWSFYLSCFSW